MTIPFYRLHGLPTGKALFRDSFGAIPSFSTATKMC